MHATYILKTMHAGGSSVLNMTVEQVRVDLVRVGWVPPSPAPARGYKIVTTGTNTTVTETSVLLTLSPGTHTIEVLPLTQHFFYEPVTVNVTVRGT